MLSKPAFLFLAAFCFLPLLAWSQTAQTVTLPIRAEVAPGGTSVTLSWPALTGPGTLQVRRRLRGATQWTTLLNSPSTAQASLTDNDIQAGLIYEYAVQRVAPAGGVTAYGFALVAAEAPSTDFRGRLLLWIDSTLLDPLAPELDRLRADLIGDGWQIVERHAGTSATAASVKGQIVADYNATAPTLTRAVFLLGAIPVPYSGNQAWDGHTDHAGAWPADAYYGELTGNWTDAAVNNTTASRPANHNVPGDGKFDQSSTPTSVELQVGRVDFRRLNPATFGVTSTIDLYRRYLDKDHAWRIGQYTVPERALVDDNFGYFNGEAFASNGWRNAYPLVGDSNVVAGDFFGDTNPGRFLMAYGCGGGWYSGAGGVGSSDNFATDTIHAVFTMLFGSYHGDWDYETNPFMPSALASAGGILTCSWAGRPHWFYHPLAAGETIGFCTQLTQNSATGGIYPTAFGTAGAHVSLLGDPTLRAHVVPRPASVQPEPVCAGAALSWTASPDTSVIGYHVYFSLSYGGPYVRRTDTAITTLYYSEPLSNGLPTVYYQVRAVRRQTSPGGGVYFNTSTGIIVPVDPADGLELDVPPVATLPCNGQGVALSAQTGIAGVTYTWSHPSGWSSTEPSPVVNEPGTYTVTATAPNGCTAVASVVVAHPVFPAVSLTLPALHCNMPCVTLAPSPALPIADTLVLCIPGTYDLDAVDPATGCPLDITAVLPQAPDLLYQLTVTDPTPGSSNGAASITVSGGLPPYTYQWSNGATTPEISGLAANFYGITVTDAVGCSVSDNFPVGISPVNDPATAQAALNVYPNPSPGPVTIELPGGVNAAVDVVVSDVQGRSVWQRRGLTAVHGLLPVDLGALPPGRYTVRIDGLGKVLETMLVIGR